MISVGNRAGKWKYLTVGFNASWTVNFRYVLMRDDFLMRATMQYKLIKDTMDTIGNISQTKYLHQNDLLYEQWRAVDG